MSIIKYGSLIFNISLSIYLVLQNYSFRSNQKQDNSNYQILIFVFSPILQILCLMKKSYCYVGHCKSPHHYKNKLRINQQNKQHNSTNQYENKYETNSKNKTKQKSQLKNKYKNIFQSSSINNSLEKPLLRLENITDDDKFKYDIDEINNNNLNNINQINNNKDHEINEQKQKQVTESTNVNEFSNLLTLINHNDNKSNEKRITIISSQSRQSNNNDNINDNINEYESAVKLTNNNKNRDSQKYKKINSQNIQNKTNKSSAYNKNEKQKHSPVSTVSFDCQSCEQCVIPKYIRMKHCYRCKKCVHKYDHHCVLLDICIGESNQKYYYLMLWFMLINTIVYIKELLFKIKLEVVLDQNGIEHVSSYYLLYSAIIIVLTFVIILLTYLLYIHTQFIINGLTTYQKERYSTITYFKFIQQNQHLYKKYHNLNNQQIKKNHPFDYGILQNIKFIFTFSNQRQPIDWKLPQITKI